MLTDDGYLQFTCDNCGYTYVDTSVQFDPEDTGIAAHDLGEGNDEPAHTHIYNVVWTWAADNSSATGAVTCEACDFTDSVTVDSTVVTVQTPDCTNEGLKKYTVASDEYNATDSKTVKYADAAGHAYNVEWDWAADGSAASVTVTCTKCDFEQTADADEITSEVTTVQTCTTKGKTTYTTTVTVAGETYTSTKTLTDIPADGHDYVDTWNWAADGSEASVTVTCTKCDLEVTVDGGITSEKTKDQTCTVKGETTYTATATADEHLFADSKTVADIPADGHDYIDAWAWAEDGSTATVTVTCTRCDLNETEAAVVTSEKTIDQTCTEHGETTYTAKADVDGKKFTSEKKIFDVTPDGHTYVPTWDWADDGKSVTLTVNCTKDDFEETVVLEGSDVASEVSKAQTCTEKGDTTYSVSVVVAGETYESSKTVTDIEPDGHTYIHTWNWAEDGKSATLTVTCEKGDFNKVVPVETTGEVTTEPLCTVKGYTTYTAAAEVADITYTDTKTVQDVPELNHDYVLVNAEDETCTAPSMEYYECSRCDSTKTTHDTPEKGHDFNGEYKYDAATKTHTRLCLNDCGTYGDEKVCRFDDGVISYDASHLSVDEYADGYKNGTVYFEYILPCTSKEAIFETGAMGWLVTSREATYELVEEEIEFNGELVTAQILRGSILLTPNKNNASAIGASYNTLPVAVRIMDMKNGTQFAPAFTMWMGGNDVNTTYKGKYGGIPTSIVYGSDYLCPEHDKYEYESFTAPSVEVTAAPSYNVQLKKGTHANNTSIGSYDFTTGNELAQNKDAGVVDGRMYGFGLTLQLYGKSADKGMMGVELPDGSPITFDLKLDTAYTAAGAEVEKGYQALLWSGDANADRANADGRDSMTATNYMLGVAPLNESKNPDKYNLTNDYNRCKDGGNWSFVVDDTDPSIIHVTVTDYVADLTSLPYANTNETASTSKTYYNYKTVGSQYWKIQQACISAGEVWVVQPYKNYDETSENYGKHIVDVYGSGTVRTTLTDMNLDMTGISGVSTIDDGVGQALKTDDMGMFDYVYVRPGSRTTYIRYTKYNSPSTSLTTNCEYSNGDWGVSGQKIAIYGVTESAGSEGDNSAVATSNLIKFDDKFFIPENSSVTSQTSTAVYTPNRNAYWGAKPDKTGWDHNGLMPDEDGYDDDMLRTTADDLIWFSSLSELQEQGYVAVAVIYEQLGLTNSSKYGGYNSVSHYVRGSIDKDCPVNYAYMAAVEGYIWSKADIAAATMEYFGLEKAEDLTDEMYSAYVKSDKFFTRANNEKLSDNANQPGYIYNSAANSSFLNPNAVHKAVYEGFEYKSGAGAPYYIDSCYTIPFSSKITAAVAQDNEDGTDKKIYDMGQNQRVVDYVLNPYVVCEVNTSSDKVEDVITTTVTITSTLPKGLTYIMGSSFYDPTYTATYKQDDTYQVPGTIKGALNTAPVATVNADGTTTLVWTFKDTEINPNEKVTDLGFIYYSAKIGTPENEATDVVNQQQLTNSVSIEADLDACRELDILVGNYAEVSIEALKLTAFSFTKVADCDVVDAGDTIGYTITAGNNAATIVKNSIMVEALPYDGDAKGSHFNGDLFVTKFAAASPDKVYRDFKYFYTTNKMYRDYTGMTFVEEGYTMEDFESSEDWTLLTLSAGDLQKGLFTDFPSADEQKGEGQIVCIVVVGNLHPQETLMFRVELSASELHAQDKLVNSFSREKLSVESSVVVVKREISGHAWVDRNPNGEKEDHEEFLSDVVVTLLRKDEDGNLVPVTYTDKDGNIVEAKVPTGKTLNLITGEITDAKDEGSYAFIGVPEGTYAVTFDGGNKIDDIVMPSAREIKNSEVYIDPHNNMGLTLTSVTTNVTWDDLDDLDKLRKPYGVTLYANGEPYGEEIFSDGINELTYTWNELPMCSNGEIIEYKVVVTTLPDGYETVYNGHDIALTRNPALYLLPVIFFAPDNIGFYLADGIEFYLSAEGKNKYISNHTIFNDSTTIYVVRGTHISFKPYTIFTSYKGGYATSLKSGTDSVTSLPQIITEDDTGYFHFRVYDSYNFVSLVQVMKDPDTGESVPWWTVVINLVKKFIAFIQRLFKF